VTKSAVALSVRNSCRRTLAAAADAVGLGPVLRRRRELARIPPSPFGVTTPHYDARRGLFEFRGSWRQIGRQAAEAYPPSANVETARMILESSSAQRSVLMSRVDAALDTLATSMPEVREMLDGVAETGIGSLREVALANLTPQLVDARSHRGCGAIAMRGPDGIIFAQNLDLGPTNAVSAAILRPQDGLAFVTHFNPGTLWFTTGMNERGLLVGGASVNVDREFEVDAVKLSDCFMDILLLARADTVASAVGLLKDMPGSAPANSGIASLLADRTGNIAVSECTGSDLEVQGVEFGVVANLFRSPRLVNLNRTGDPVSDAVFDNSKLRIAAAEAWMAQQRTSYAGLCDFIRGGSGPGAWCRSAVPPDIGWTSSTYCFDVASGRMDFWNGIAPHHPPRRVLDLASVFQRTFR
jgi:predicted choloylglycine hydrolase